MQIRRDFAITLDEDTFIQMYGERGAALFSSPERRATLREALAEAREALAPAAAWDRFAIAGLRHERVALAQGALIGGGPVAQVVRGAEELVVAVCTAGGEIDARVAAWQGRGEMFRAMLLDELGSWAVDVARQELCLWLDDAFAAQGWRTSTPLSPGESEWSVADQAVIFDLLDAGQIGVTLNEGLVMVPTKSLSLIMGVGRQPMGAEGKSNCDFCSMKERCRYREHRAV
jgi:hypothetical protein